MAYEAQISGFKSDCRHVIGLDGCCLKGPAGGVLLSAMSHDANNQIFPITVADLQWWTLSVKLLGHGFSRVSKKKLEKKGTLDGSS